MRDGMNFADQPSVNLMDPVEHQEHVLSARPFPLGSLRPWACWTWRKRWVIPYRTVLTLFNQWVRMSLHPDRRKLTLGGSGDQELCDVVGTEYYDLCSRQLP